MSTQTETCQTCVSNGRTCQECTLRRSREYARQPEQLARQRERRHTYRQIKPELLRNSAKRYWSKQTQEQKTARRIIANALKRKDITRPQACSDCGNTGRIEAHHPDYSRPMDVEWLCPVCHGKRHRKYS